MLQVTPSGDVSTICSRSHHLVMSVLFVAGNTAHHSATQGPRVWATGRERTTGSHDHWLCSQERPHNGIHYRGLSHFCYFVSLLLFLIAWNNYTVPTQKSVYVILTVNPLKRERHWEYIALYHNKLFTEKKAKIQKALIQRKKPSVGWICTHGSCCLRENFFSKKFVFECVPL